MNNFVLLYHFEDKQAEKVFEKGINEGFSRHKKEEAGPVQYFGFAERAEPAAVDKLNTILNRVESGTKDYVALYHAGKNDRDVIQRQMLIGHDSLVETKIRKLSEDAHKDTINNLLDFNYLKAEQMQQHQKEKK